MESIVALATAAFLFGAAYLNHRTERERTRRRRDPEE